jgi:uncharacterized protein YdeI (YjbR/CyaY-like superfamily)
MSSPFGRDLKRDIQQMPGFVKTALAKEKLMDAYRARPDYQQNDYLGWINRAKGPETKQKRLAQMIEELKKGDLYMEAEWHPPAPVK